MIVVITAAAEAELEAIGAVIARDSPRRAETSVREPVERCERLAGTPRGVPLVPRYEHAGIRRRPYGEYLIFYRLGGGRIEILHSVNGARDDEALLFAPP